MNIEEKAAEMRKSTELLVTMHRANGNDELAQEWEDAVKAKTPEELAALYDNVQSGEYFKSFTPGELAETDKIISEQVDSNDKLSYH